MLMVTLPVTPEVAGSSPVAPVSKTLQTAGFSCFIRQAIRKTAHGFAHIRLSTAVALLVLVASLAFLTDARAASTYERRLAVMRQVWGPTYREALTVAVCESGLNPRASNGQFKGVFQMGSRERARWGHGPGVSHQARAAKRYYTYAKSIGWGNGWGPWECQP